MFTRIFNANALRTGLIIILALLAGCSATRFADRYQPGASEVVLWSDERIPIEPGWRFLGTETVSVRGDIRDTALSAIDHMQSLVFVREGERVPSILLLSRVIKTGDTEVFVFLGGTKTALGDETYRENSFSLSGETTDQEYRRYLERVRAEGLGVAPNYTVRVLDRLPVDSVLVRVMELTPGDGPSPLPAYGKLYPQERLDPILNNFR